MINGGTAGVPRGRVLLVVVLAAALVLSVASVHLASRARGADAGRCERHAAAAAWRASLVSGRAAAPRVVVIGDSYAVGLGLAGPARSWPSRLAGRVHVAGFSGSGWSAGASRCEGVSFADRTAAAVRGGAALVVVGTGLNDVDQTDAAITVGFEQLVRRVPGGSRVVVVGPPTAPARAGGVPRVDALLRELAVTHEVGYVGTADLELPYLSDGLHLTPEGHRRFGDAVADRIAALAG